MTHLDRFSGGMAASVAMAGVGVLANADALLVAATVPLVYVVYGSLTRVSVDPEDLVVERELERTSAFPGDRVEVTLTVRNEGSSPVPDLRVVDGVPEDLPVVEGSPRGAVALRAGEAATVEYAVVANRGDHPFDPVTVRARSLSADDVGTVELDPDGASALSCSPHVDEVPLSVETTQFAGRVRTDSAGSGLEFHSTREYHHGDPVARIDWRRLARGEELSTINYREHRAARVVLLVDTRNPCYVAPGAGIPTGAAMSAFGATRALATLLADGHEVGLATFGVRDEAEIGPAWVPPGRGEELEIRVRKILEDAATAPEDADENGAIVGTAGTHDGDGADREGDEATVPAPNAGVTGTPALDGGHSDLDVLRDRLPPDAQVLFFTPAVDTFPLKVVEELRAYDYGVTVVSPDVTHDDDAGGKMRTIERTLLLDELRGAGARTIDWARDRPLALVLAEALQEVIR